jgi:hypothetical protein
LLQRGDKRPQEERRGCSGGVLLLGVPKRVALAVFGFLQRRVFPREQTPISYPETLMCKIYILRFFAIIT